MLLISAPTTKGASTGTSPVGGLGIDSIAIDPVSDVLLAVDGYGPCVAYSQANSANLLGISMPADTLMFNVSLVSAPVGGCDSTVYDVASVSNIAVDPTSGVAYVGVNYWDCNSSACPWYLEAFDVTSGALVANVSVDAAVSVAVDPSTHLVFAAGVNPGASGNSTDLDEVSEATNTVVARLNVTGVAGGGVSGLTVDTANHMVYGIASPQGFVALNESPLSLAYNTTSIGGTLVVDPGLGLLYDDDANAPGLNVVSAATNDIIGYGPSASDFIGVNTNTHLVFLASNGQNAVEVDTPGGGNLLIVTNLIMSQNASAPAARAPYGIAVDSSRNLVYVATNSTVQVLDASSVSVTTSSSASQPQSTTTVPPLTTSSSAARTTSSAAQRQTTTAGSTSPTGSGGGIPEYPFQLLAVTASILLVLVAYLAVRMRMRKNPPDSPPE